MSRPGWFPSVVGLALLLMGCTSIANSSDNPSRETMAQPTVPVETAPAETASTEAVPLGLAQTLPVGATVQLGGETIELEVTRTGQEQAMGLMYRQMLPDNRGMLFSFQPARPVQFWMKNVVIDLDMVFLHRGKIVEIAAQVPPCRENPCPTYGPAGKLVDQVIELRGGRAAELGLKRGDTVVIEPLGGEENLNESL